MLNIRDFGAVADGKTVNTKAIQAAVDRAGETGETVLVPGGVFITGTIHLNGAFGAGRCFKGLYEYRRLPCTGFYPQ